MMYLKLRHAGTGPYFLPDVGIEIPDTTGDDYPDAEIARQLAKSDVLRQLVNAGTIEVDSGSGWLSPAAGEQYLEEVWLRAAGDTPPDFTQISGTITDLQHGNRGAGTLHPAATPTVAGFMSPTDKGKLDGIGNQALPRMSFSFGDSTGSGVQKTGTGFAAVRYFRFPGTTAAGKTTGFVCKMIFRKSSGPGTSTVAARVYDETNGAVIALQSGVTLTTRAIYTPVVSNLPAAEALFRLDIEGGQGASIDFDFLEIY